MELDNWSLEQKEDFKVLYQPIANSISFSKSQQWYIVYYSLAGLGGIVGLSGLFSCRMFNCILIFFAFLITLLATCYILKNELTMVNDRRRLVKIRKISFDGTVLAELKLDIPKNYKSIFYDWYYWIPIMFTPWMGLSFVLTYLILRMETAINQLVLWIIIFIICGIIAFLQISVLYATILVAHASRNRDF